MDKEKTISAVEGFPYREGEFDNLSITDWQSILPNILISKLIKKIILWAYC